MRKLLSANLSRLRKNKMFWCVLSVVILTSLLCIFNGARSCASMLGQGYERSLDDYYFSQAPMMGAFLALFASTFFGTEYSDGTIRNKLIVGHRRDHVYLSSFLVCSMASLVLLTAWLLSGALGFWLIGPMEMGMTGFLAYLVVAIGFTISFASIYTLIGCLSSNKAMTIVYTFLVFLAGAMAASGLWDRLCVPEINEGMMFINGEFVTPEPTPNPLYLSGTIRTICQWVLELIPSGQALLMNDVAIENPVRAIFFSAVFTVMTLALGCGLFRRKDIK